MERKPSKFQVMPGDWTFSTKETTKCYDCIHRLLPDPWGFQNWHCNMYPNKDFKSKGKPSAVLFCNADCEFYKRDLTLSPLKK